MTNRRAPREILGAIYDMDDTYLDNQPTDNPIDHLHQQSRLAALHELGRRADVLKLFPRAAALMDVTAEVNMKSFETAREHTVHSATWQVLHDFGILNGEYLPGHDLVLQAVNLKQDIYHEMLKQHGKPIKGANEFVRDLAAHYGIESFNAIASMGFRRDLIAIVAMFGTSDLFPENRIVGFEDVTRPKPDPQAFDEAFSRLDLPERARQNVLAFEDAPLGMLSARKAGLYVCGIATRYSADTLRAVEAQPDFVFDTYDEARDYFDLPPALAA